MALYAGESVAAVHPIEPAAHIIQSWCERQTDSSI
jgi:hypothetical protein